MAKQTKKNESSVGTVAAVGAGVIAVAAASYFFFGPEGKKNRHNLKGWMIKMKGEIIEKMEDAKDVSEAAYERIVDAVAAKYAKAGKISEAEIRMFAGMLKQQWKGIAKSHNRVAAVTASAKATARQGKKSVKKVVKAASAGNVPKSSKTKAVKATATRGKKSK